MSRIDQTYATHCTYGTSALERRSGEIAARPVGYSARASSLPAAELANVYRRIERYLSYHLPADAPSELKLSWTPATAPRRMLYLPGVGDLQVVAQICYRQFDCSTPPRPGSYFAHILTCPRDADRSAFSTIDCLEFWNSKRLWTCEDDPDLEQMPHELPSLDADALARATDAARRMHERALVSFLTTPAGGPFDALASAMMPPRWRAMEAGDRRRQFTRGLKALLESLEGVERRRPVLFVVEPEAAPLFFYGIARLLPAGPLRDGMSFSTYEARADGVCTDLAAVVFHDPAANDVDPELYRRGLVINTYRDKASESIDRNSPLGDYAELLVGRVVESVSLAAADLILHRFEAAGAVDAGRFRKLAATRPESHLQALFDPTAQAATMGRQLDPLLGTYLKQGVLREFSTQLSSATVQSLIHPFSRLHALLNVLGDDWAHKKCRQSVNQLLGSLNEAQYAELLHSSDLDDGLQIAALKAFMVKNRRLPKNASFLCDALLRALALESEVSGRANSLLKRALDQFWTSAKIFDDIWAGAGEQMREALLCYTLDVAGRTPTPHGKLPQRTFASFCRVLPENMFCHFIAEHRKQMQAVPWDPNGLIVDKLRTIVEALKSPEESDLIAVRLDAVAPMLKHLGEAYLQLDPWTKIRQQFREIKAAAIRARAPAIARSSQRDAPSIDLDRIGRDIHAELKLVTWKWSDKKRLDAVWQLADAEGVTRAHLSEADRAGIAAWIVKGDRDIPFPNRYRKKKSRGNGIPWIASMTIVTAGVLLVIAYLRYGPVSETSDPPARSKGGSTSIQDTSSQGK